MSDLSITVPSGCVERFRKEVLTDLRSAAENVVEAVDWMGDNDKPDRINADLARFTESERLFRQVHHAGPDDLTVNAGKPMLAGLLRMAIIQCIEDAQQTVDQRRPVDALRGILSAFSDLLDLIDNHDLSTPTGDG